MSSTREPAARHSENATDKASRSKTGLLPCPFCGSVDLDAISYEGKDGDGRKMAFIQCCGCHSTGPVVEEMAAARGLWDIRAEKV
jgi:hypothetical protein